MVRCIVLNLRLIRTPHLTATTPLIPSAPLSLDTAATKPPSIRRSVCGWTPSRFRLQGSERKALTLPVPLPLPRPFAPAEQPLSRFAPSCSWTRLEEGEGGQRGPRTFGT